MSRWAEETVKAVRVSGTLLNPLRKLGLEEGCLPFNRILMECSLVFLSPGPSASAEMGKGDSNHTKNEDMV